MKGIEAFKEELMYDSDLADYFYGAESMEEIVEKAEKKGFNFTVDDLQQDELSEEIFESVCGAGAPLNKQIGLHDECISWLLYVKEISVKEIMILWTI